VKAPLTVLLVLAAACRSQPTTDAGATGTLQYVEIEVAPLAAARVVRVDRHEGDVVKPGDTLVVLTQATLRPNVEAQQARVTTANAQLLDLVAGARPTEVAQAESELRAAQAEADRTARDVDRLAPLAERTEVSRQDFDAAQTASRTAAARRDALRDRLHTLQAGARPEEIGAARSEVAAAQAALRAATATQSDLVLTSPVSGTVVTRVAEPGAVISPGAPAMTVADVTRPFVRVYVNQAMLPTLHVGSAVAAVLDELPGKSFAGRIAAIATQAEFTPRVALTRDERADLVFAVRVEFVDTSGMLKAGLPVTVRFGAVK
jgi:HlyD family secretion protein